MERENCAKVTIDKTKWVFGFAYTVDLSGSPYTAQAQRRSSSLERLPSPALSFHRTVIVPSRRPSGCVSFAEGPSNFCAMRSTSHRSRQLICTPPPNQRRKQTQLYLPQKIQYLLVVKTLPGDSNTSPCSYRNTNLIDQLKEDKTRSLLCTGAYCSFKQTSKISMAQALEGRGEALEMITKEGAAAFAIVLSPHNPFESPI